MCTTARQAEQAQTDRPVHPFVAAFGPGPFSIFAVVRVPSLALRDRDAELWGRLLDQAIEKAAAYRVELGRCGCCGRQASETIIGEADRGPASERARFGLCRTCIKRHGGRTMRMKLAWIDRTHEGYARTAEIRQRREAEGTTRGR